MSTRREREEIERAQYRRKLDQLVDAIIARGEQAGRVYTKYDRMRIRAFQDERNISDYELNAELEGIDEMERRDKQETDF